MAEYKKAAAAWETQAADDRAAGRRPPRKPRSPLGVAALSDADQAAYVHDQAVEHYAVANPSGLYNGMVAPLVPFAIRGVIWYQGESNFMRGTVSAAAAGVDRRLAGPLGPG